MIHSTHRVFVRFVVFRPKVESELAMKYGMNMLLWTANVTEDHFHILRMLKEAGFDGVELPIFEMDVEKFSVLGKELDHMGLERTAVAVCTDEANPISPELAVRTAGLIRLKEAIDCCQAAGVKLLCGPLHSALGVFSGKEPTQDEWAWGKDVLVRAAEYAQQADVVLAIEALNRFECYFLNDVASSATFCRDVNHPNLKMMYDTFHANIEEKSLADAMQSCWDQVVHVHISENDRSTPGKGHVDWKTTFGMLKELKYDCWLTVEAFGLSLPELAAATKIWRRMYSTETDVAQYALAFMKEMMGTD